MLSIDPNPPFRRWLTVELCLAWYGCFPGMTTLSFRHSSLWGIKWRMGEISKIGCTAVNVLISDMFVGHLVELSLSSASVAAFFTNITSFSVLDIASYLGLELGKINIKRFLQCYSALAQAHTQKKRSRPIKIFIQQSSFCFLYILLLQ